MHMLARLVLLAMGLLPSVYGQSNSFTYQGNLVDKGAPANGVYDLVFSLYDHQTNGNLLALPITNLQTSVKVGVFSTALDYGMVFDGLPCWLEIAARSNGGFSFATLSPRQLVSPTPYAITSYHLSDPGVLEILSRSVTNTQLLVTQAIAGLVRSNDMTAQITASVKGLANVSFVSNQVDAVSHATRSGVWLEHAGSSSYFGNDGSAFRNAYVSATNGDTVFLGPGVYPLVYFELNKPVSIIGSGSGAWDTAGCYFSGGTIFEGALFPQVGFSNCCLRHFSVQSGGDIMMFGLCYTNLCNCILEDIALGCTNGQNTHNFEASGNGIYVNGLRSYNGGNNGIVFKGATNVVAMNLYCSQARGQAVYIKASNSQKGNSGNIDINGVNIDGATSYFIIQAVDKPAVVSRVSIRNVHVKSSSGFWMESYAGSCLANITIKDATIDGGWLATIVGHDAATMKSVQFSDCQIVNCENNDPIFVFGSFPSDVSQVSANNCWVGQTRYDCSGSTVKQCAYLAQAIGPSWKTVLSLGIPSNQIHSVTVSDGTLYCAWSSNFPMTTDCLAPGDPVWISGGSVNGVYKAAQFGDCFVDGVPPGARVGDHWVALLTTNSDGSYSAGDILPGKVVGKLDATEFRAVCELTASATCSIANTLESSSTRFFVCAASSNSLSLSPFSKPVVYQTISQLVPAYAWAWNGSSQGQTVPGVLIGIFGGVSSIQGWYPAYFNGAGIEFKSSGYPIRVSATNRW